MSSIARTIAKSLGNIPLDRHSCQLLGPTALVVQALMGVLAVLSLVYKRQRETQKRPWQIWLFDVSKQVVGAMFIHGLNVLISDFGSYQFAGNACTYYFLNILLDTTLGVGLIYVVLHCSTWLLSKRLGIKGLKSGQYGNPPSLVYWFRQAAVYIFALTGMKLLVVALFAFWPGIFAFGDWLLGWTTFFEGESVQVIFVMGVFPMIMNIVQFWLIDSIVKASTSQVTVHAVVPRNSDSQDHEPLFNSPDDDDDAPPRDVEDGPGSSTSTTTSHGDFQTLVGAEDNKTKLMTSGSSTPMTLPRTAVVVVHDYPPSSVGSTSSQSSTRPRHKYKRGSLSLLDFPVTYSAAAVNTLDSSRNSSRQVLPSSLNSSAVDASDVAEFDVWEKGNWERRAGSDGWNARRSEQRIPISAR